MPFRRTHRHGPKTRLSRSSRLARWSKPAVERLEDRTLLTGQQNWMELGPSPQFGNCP
jgi:hypothetical protein